MERHERIGDYVLKFLDDSKTYTIVTKDRIPQAKNQSPGTGSMVVNFRFNSLKINILYHAENKIYK